MNIHQLFSNRILHIIAISLFLSSYGQLYSNCPVTLNASQTSICQGSSSTLTANGTSTYQWLQDTSNTSNILIVSPSTSSTYTVIGSSGTCSSTATIVVNVLIPPSVSITVSGSSATAVPTGGSSPYTYLWSNGATSSSISGVPPSQYTVVVTDANGCKGNASAIVGCPIASISATSNTICSGSSVTLTASGYNSYVWNNDSTKTGSTLIVTPNFTTTYNVLGTSGTCTGNATITITVSKPVVKIVMFGNYAVAQVTGGIPPYTYTWSNGSSQSFTTFSAQGIYTVSVVDNFVCTSLASVNFGGSCSASFTIKPDSTNTNIFYIHNNTAGIPPMNYIWNWGDGSADDYTAAPIHTYTSPNTYTINLTITDGSGYCTATHSAPIVITEANKKKNDIESKQLLIPTVVQVLTIPGCPNTIVSVSSSTICSGSSTTLTAGGASSYLWSHNSATTSSIIVSPTTSTSYTVSGASGTCSINATVFITVLPSPAVSTTVTGNNAIAAASGGTPPYTYIWSNGANTPYISGVAPGVYSVIATDSKGCSGNTSATISCPSTSISTNYPVICVGGSATLTATGANTYNWGNSSSITTNTLVVSPIVTTTYYVTGITGTCSSTASITINVSQTTITTSSATICSGNSATLTATGANTYNWGNSSSITTNTLVVSPVVTTTYVVTGISGACSSSASITIVVNNPIVSITTSGNTAYATVNGGTPPYIYSWSNGSSQSSTTLGAQGIYTINVVDAIGCPASGTVNYTGLCSSSFSIHNNTNSNQFSILNSSSGVSPVAYTWSWGDGTANDVSSFPSHTYTSSGTYTISLAIVDGTGCSKTFSTYLFVSPSNTPAVVTVLGGTSVNEELIAKNQQAYLFAPYPNPIENKTTFRVHLEETDIISLMVLDISGREVYRFVSNEKLNRGDYYFDFSSNNLSGGSYYLFLNSTNGTQTRPFTIVK